ncbi:hypothetical protein [Mobilicoccus sp.]|uniref:hypothetical protein n=1 Tax=Mobilicoccus sp. TaxID=2034349 RepID=UPI0028988740|nr:hypothetical protein [Mobilicoccus sp.]
MFNRHRSSLVVTALACLLGLGAGMVAVSALGSAAPDDARAATTGPASQVSSSELLSYGG